MAALGGLFGGNKPEKHPNFDHIAEAIHRNFALGLAPASPEVLVVLDTLTSRELLNFDNAHSIEGLQELFMVRSIRTAVDPQTHAMGLSLMAAAQVEEELKAEHSQVRTMHISQDHGARPIIKPAASAPILGARLAVVAGAAAIAPLPPAFEHLVSVEALCVNIVDLFVRYGQLTSADKDILKKIKPINTTVEARIVMLERWQTELKRRVRAMTIPKAAVPLSLDADVKEQPKTEEELVHRFKEIIDCSSDGEGANPEQLARRFEAIIAWLMKLIKEFEGTGVKYQNKPMWLR